MGATRHAATTGLGAISEGRCVFKRNDETSSSIKAVDTVVRQENNG